MNPKRYETLRVIVREHPENPAWAACGELLAEVDLLRAGVEVVRALPRYGYDSVGRVHIIDMDDRWLDRGEVLAALGES